MLVRSSNLATCHSPLATRRRGMSMAEVLVALFLMALGSLAILTMFPLGMFHMGQALKDDRTAQSASQADAFMRSYWRQAVIESPNQGMSEPFVQAFTSPNGTSPLPVPLRPAAAPISFGPSYPVFVDPMGYVAPWQGSAFSKDWVAFPGVTPPPYIPRRSLNGIVNPQRTCSLMDGFGYADNGVANSIGGSTIERELRYNWLWVVQRPDNNVPNIATMTVVVFDKRAYLFAPANAETSFTWDGTSPPGPANLVSFVPFTTSIFVPKSIGAPAVQKGGWIMDGTAGLNHAIFYRVVSVTDNPNNAVLGVPTTDLELQSPIRRLDGGSAPYFGTLVYLAGVSEVFERPNLGPSF